MTSKRGRFRGRVIVVAVSTSLVISSGMLQAAPVLASSNYAATVLSDSPQGYWRLGETSGTTAADASGHSNVLTYAGGYTLGVGGSIAGDSNAAVQFNGSTATANRTSSPVTTTTNWSVEAWVNPASTSQHGVIVYNGKEDTADGGYGFAISASNSLTTNGSELVGAVNGAAVDSGFAFTNANTWYHVVMTRDTSTIRFYVNGRITTKTSNTAPTAPSGRFSLGSGVNNAGSVVQPFNGVIDEAAIYSSVLSAGRAGAHYQEGSQTIGGIGQWASFTPVVSGGTLTARSDVAITYDAAHSKVVMFGGKNASGTAINETWTYDPSTNTWTKLAPAHSPSIRWGARMAFDTATNNAVLFGGTSASGSGYLSDTWTWNGTDWTQLSPATVPPTRADAGMAYDAGHNVVVMFGGNGGTKGTTYYATTYTWNGTNWTLASSTGVSSRSGVAMAYDSKNSKTVLFGGFTGSSYLGDTFTWNGSAWSTTSSATSPSVRTLAGAAFDPIVGKVVLFGGYNGTAYQVDTWAWDNTNWALQNSSANPAARSASGFLWNPPASEIQVFGGINSTGALSDNWRWTTPPDVPTNVTGVSGNQQVIVSWTAPGNGGATITQYVVTASPGGATATSSGTPAPASATVTGLTNGTAYTFTVVATNGVGTSVRSAPSAAVTPATVPGAPTGVSATAGNAQATVTWTPPSSNGGSAITGYTVTSAPGGFTAGAGAGATSATVTGLANGTVYTFTVTATNAVGTGPASSPPSNAVTPATVPGAPTNAVATAGNSQATVTWTAPASNGGSAITRYTVTSSPGSFTANTPDGNTTTATVTGLTNGTSYTFTVTATNVVGPGPASSPSNAITPATVPGAPTNVVATAGNGQATVTWSAPSSNGGSAITQYTVTPFVGTTAGTPVTVNGSTTTATVTGLVNGTAYTFQVTATNSLGMGLPGTSNTVTPTGPPYTPASVTATGGNAQATVSWTAPGNGGSPITGYTVTPYIGTAAGTPVNVGASTTTTTIINLFNGTTYTFQVTATNALGTSAPGTSNAVTPATVPQPPGSVTAVGGNAQASVTWTAPNNGGSAITGYTITPYVDTTAGTPVSVGPAVLTATFIGLMNGTTYTFQVVAANAVGNSTPGTSNAVTPATVPGAPTNVTAASGNAQATVSWSAPASNGGAVITGYTMTPFVGGTAGTPVTVDGTTLTATATGLMNGTVYTFQVYATNSAGNGPFAASAPITVGLPGAPTAVTATAAANQASVSWTAPASSGASAITGYIVTAYTSATAQNSTAVAGSATSAAISGLKGGTAYSFQVIAVNSQGAGPSSSPSSTVTPSGAGTTYASTVLANSPAAYYRLGDPSGGIAADSSGNANHGAYNGASTLGSTGVVSGDPDTAVSVDGNSGYVSAPTLAALQADNTRTVEIWFKTTNGTQQMLFDSGTTGVTGQLFEIALTQQNGLGPGVGPPQNTPGLVVGFGNADAYIPGLYLADGHPHYLAVTLTGQTVYVYVDGVAAAGSVYNGSGWTALGAQPFTLPVTPNTPGNQVWIGRGRQAFWTGSSSFAGTIDEVAIYPTALTSTQIIARAQAAGYLLGAATNVAASAGANQASVTWTAPSNISVATSLVVTAYAGAQPVNAVALDPSATTATITGLRGSTAYTFTVVASNSFGASPLATSNAVTPSGAPTTYSSTVIGDTPSLYYRLGDPSGNVAADSSGNARNGSYQNTPFTLGASGALVGDGDPATGFASNCCNFGQPFGGSELQYRGSSGLPMGSSSRTVEIWIKTTSPNTMGLVGYGNTPSLQGFQVALFNGNVIGVISGSNDAPVYFTSPSTIANGGWHLITVTYDGTVLTVYVDGQAIGTGSFAGALNTQPGVTGLILAHYFWCGVGCNQFNGTFDELAVYPAALTGVQVLAHFDASGNTRPTVPGSVAATAGSNQAAITWSASTASAGAPVTGYLVTAYLNGTQARNAIAVGGSTTSVTISGLQGGGASYTFVVVALNNFGYGSPSAATAAISPTGAAFTYSSTVLGDSPSIYLRLSDPSGTVAADSSGNAHNGWYQNTPYTLGVTGALVGDGDAAATFQSNCCYFGTLYNGSEMQDKLPNGLPAGNSSRTVEVWVNTTFTSQMGLVGWGNSGALGGFQVEMTNGNQILVLTGSGDPFLTFTSSYTIANGHWHVIDVTYDGTTLTVYLDGQLLGTGTFGGALNTQVDGNGLILAHRYYCGVGCDQYNGTLDEVAIYAAALTATQIAALFSASGNSRATAPTNVTASAGANQVTVTWAASTASSGSPVTGYLVTAYVNGSQARNAIAVGGGTTGTTISGLLVGTSYTFQVVAYDNFGAGPASSPTAGVSPTGATPMYAGTVLGDSPSIYYRLGDPSGTIAADSSGNGRNGWYQSTPYTLAVSGALPTDGDSAVTFASGCCYFGQPTGGSEMQYKTGAGLPTGNSARTVELWVKTTNTGQQALVGWGSTSAHSTFEIRLLGGNQVQVVSWSDDKTFTAPSPIATGMWRHLVVTYDGAILTVYLDMNVLGTSTFSAQLTTTISPNGLILAHDVWGGVGSSQLNGSLDEVAIYSSVLTQLQVNAHYAASGNTQSIPSAPTGVSATGGVNQATVTWTAPSTNGGSPITTYTITPHSGTTSRTPTFVAGSLTSSVVAGLSGGTTYFFTVTAANANGSGPDSAPSNSVTPTGTVYPYAGTVLGDTPVGYWRLGEASGTTAYDSSGNGNIGTFVGGTTLNQGGAIRNDPDPGTTVDGTSGHVSVRNSATLDVTGALSVEAWVNFSSTSGIQQIVCKGDGATTNGTAYQLVYRSGSGISFETYASSGNNASALWRAAPQTGAWYYVVGTRTADGALAIYVNGVLMGTANDGGGALNDVNATVGIGASGVGTGSNLEPFAGSLDDAAVYSSALSVAQVALHWAAAANRPGAPTNVASSATAANQITVSWTAPADGGSTAITGYVVTPHIGPNLATPSFAGATATSLAVGSLSAGTSYFFTVNAINASGVGAASVPSAAVTATGTTTYPYSSTVLGDGPVGYWRLGESSGSLATDSSGNGNTGSYVSADQIGQPGAIKRDPGLSVAIDGANGQVLVPSASTINITADVTAEAWVELNSIATNQVLISKGDGATNTESAYLLAYTAGSGFTFTTFIGNQATTATYAISPTLGKWYHIVGTRTAAGNITVWVNCNADNGGAFDGGGTLNTVGSALAVGSSGSGSGSHRFPVNGLIAEAAVYNTALAPSQVAGHWGAAGYVPAAPTNVTAAGEPNGAIISWTPPSYPGTSPISGYIVTAHVGADTVGTPASVDANTTSFNYGPISGGQTYTFTVTAVNASGACGPASASSAPVSVTNPVAPNLGQHLAIVTTDIQPLPIGSFGYNTCRTDSICGFFNDTLPSMSQWTIEGYIWGLSSNGVTGGNTSWGVLNVDTYGVIGSRKRVASASRPQAGINFDIGARNGINSTLQTYFVWPGGQYPIPSDSGGLPIAADYSNGAPQAPAYFALSYDGTTVRGYVNGVLLFSQAASLASISGPGGFMDNQELGTGIFDEFRISNSARYTGSNMTPPTSNFTSDSNTILLWHMDGFALGEFLTQQVATPPFCDRPPVYITADVLIDSTGNFRAGNGTAIGTCNFHIGPEYYHSLSVGQAPAPGETRSASELKTTCEYTLFPVNCATGEFWHDFTDFSIPGRGIPLVLTRSYSSLAANTNGPLGFGWTDSYNMSLAIDSGTGNATVNEENGATMTFVNSGGTYQAPPRVLATLVNNGNGTYTFKRKSQVGYTFDSGGHLVDIVDRNIYHTTLQYPGGRLTTVTDPAGRTLTFEYNAYGLISQVTDPVGRFVQFTYDDAGVNGAACLHVCLIDVRDVGGQHMTFTYDANRRMLTMADPRGVPITNTYDAQGRVHTQEDQLHRITTFTYGAGTTTITDPKGNVTVERYHDNLILSRTRGYGTPQQATWTYTYDPISLGIASVTDPNGHVATTRYDGAGNIIGACDSMGRCTSAIYNSFNDPTSSSDQLGVVNTVVYDANGNMTSSSRPLQGSGQSAAATFTYDPAHRGDVLQMTDPNTKVWTYVYDQYGNQTSVTDPLGNTTTFVYDQIGRLASSVSPAGNVSGGNPANFTTTYGYTAYGELNSITDPLNHQTSITYDLVGNVHIVTDANNHSVTYTYDAADQLATATRNDNSTRTYVYDPNGNITSVKDGLQQATTFSYDALDRVTSTTDPLNRSTQYGYDIAGRVTTITDAMGRITYITYDAAGEPVSTVYSDGVTPNAYATYDAASRVSTMTDATGTTSYSYDSLHRLVQSINGAGSAVGYGYDLNGNITSITYPGPGHVVNRTFDSAGRLASVSDWLGHTTSYRYDANSNLIEQDYPNGVVATFTYDNADRLTSLTDALPPAAPFLSLTYGRDSVGQITSENTKSFGYDTVNRMTSATVGGTQTSYSFDDANRLTQVQIQGGPTSTYAYDAADQLQTLTTMQGGTQVQKYTYTYDANGNRAQRTDQANNSVSYAYDQANRLVAYGSSAQYAYDGTGLRMRKTVGGTTTAYTWNLASILPTLLQEGSANYVTGLGGLPLEQITSSGQVYFYHPDQLGSTRAMTDVNGAVVQTYDYDSYGNPASSSGSLTNPFQYAGQYTDAESGLQYLRARYYDPAAESFITRDPAVLLEPYSYAGGAPQSNSDPSGLDWADAARALYDGTGGWLGYVPYLGSGLEVLSAYSAIHHCEFDKASEYLGQAVMGMIGGVFAGVLGPIAKSVVKRFFGSAGKTAARAAERNALRGESKSLEGAAKAVVHGNSKASARLTYLYALYDRKTGDFLKWGITSAKDPFTRYPKKLYKDVEMTLIDQGTRRDMLAAERWLVERLPGPWNHESWAGSKASDVPWFVSPLAAR